MIGKSQRKKEVGSQGQEKKEVRKEEEGITIKDKKEKREQVRGGEDNIMGKRKRK